MKLMSLFLCNPGLSSDERTAHENILCYYPPDTPLDHQMNESGFCIALMRLQERFGVPTMNSGAPASSPVEDACSTSRCRSKVRSITLAKKRYTLIPVEDETFLCVITNRETLRANVHDLSSTNPMSLLNRTGNAAFEPGADDAALIEHMVPTQPSPSTSTSPVRHAAPSMGDRSPSIASEAKTPKSNGADAAAAPSSYLWCVPPLIAQTSDDIDEYVIEILQKLVSTSHKMFAMMFGSVRWNYERLCVLETAEARGLCKRPRKQSRDDVAADDDAQGSQWSHDAVVSAYEEDRHEQRATLVHTLKEGFIHRLVSAIHAASSTQHSMEGSFACPEGIDILPVNAETHLMVSSLVAQLANAHPGAIRDTFVVSGMKTAYSTLSVQDTTTLFYLMKYYNSAPHLSTASHRSFPTNSAGTIDSARKQQLRKSLQLHLAEETEGGGAATDDDAMQWYSPETVLRSEGRRSDFLRTMQSFADAAHQGDAPSDSYASRLDGNEKGPLSSLPVADHVEFGFPFIFLGDDDPVGVFTKDIGPLRFMFLVNEKYLRIAELRSAFEKSMERCLRESSIPRRLVAALTTTSKSNPNPSATGLGTSSGTRSTSLTSTSPAPSLSPQRASVGPLQRQQSDVMETEYLYYYRSTAISQVRSSVVQRLPGVKGSLVSPIILPGTSSVGGLVRSPTTTAPSADRRSTIVRHIMDMASSAQRRGSSVDGVEGRRKPLTAEERECVHLLDCVRSELLRGATETPRSTLILVRRKTWVSVLAYGNRDLSCVVLGKDSVDAAEASVEVLSRLVFYYAHRPPGL